MKWFRTGSKPYPGAPATPIVNGVLNGTGGGAMALDQSIAAYPWSATRPFSKLFQPARAPALSGLFYAPFMTNRTFGPGWQPTLHPTLPGFYCLVRQRATGRREQLANCISDRPPVEAFATREQAERVADYLAKTKKEPE